jgi:hypothetical protein
MITREIPAPKVKREPSAANDYDEEDEEFAISEPGSLLTEHDPAARLGDQVLLTDEHPAVEPPKRPQVDTTSEPYLATEPDAVKGLRARQFGMDKPKEEEPDTYTQSSDVRHVRLSTGIKINLNTEDKPAPKKDTGPSTELDMNLGKLLGREEAPKDDEEDEK